MILAMYIPPFPRALPSTTFMPRKSESLVSCTLYTLRFKDTKRDSVMNQEVSVMSQEVSVRYCKFVCLTYVAGVGM